MQTRRSSRDPPPTAKNLRRHSALPSISSPLATRRHTLHADKRSLRSTTSSSSSIQSKENQAPLPLVQAEEKTPVRRKIVSADSSPAVLNPRKRMRSETQDQEQGFHKSVRKSSDVKGKRRRQSNSAAVAEQRRFLDAVSGFKVQSALRLHWRNDANDDEEATLPDTWRCKFMPAMQDFTTLPILASCGSHSVCFTDCEQGVVVLKYTHLQEPNEQFQCLDWTLLPQSEEGVSIPILAVAGVAKTIKLIHYKQEICFRYLRGHSGEVVDLRFLSSAQPQRLLSASKDKRVLLWDIGDGFDPRHGGSLLMSFDTRFPALYLSVSPLSDRFLVSNTDCAIAEFELDLAEQRNCEGQKQQQQQRHRLVKPSRYYDGEGWHTSAVETLHFLDEDRILSKGYGEKQAWIWSRERSTEDHPDLIGRLESDACASYGSVACFPGSGEASLMIKGTGQGTVQIHSFFDKTFETIAAPVVLSDPRSTVAIRCVDVSPDWKYLAVSDSFDVTWLWTLMDSNVVSS